jgi:hypothetical protein
MRAAAWLALTLLTVACTPVAINTPKGFANLTDVRDQAPYDYRATTADGVVLAVRRLDRDPRDAEPAFWLEAIENQLRLRGGYALLERGEITSANGHTGTLLRFGHDQDGKPYLYELQLYATKSALFLVELGGRKDLVDKHRPALSASLASLWLKRCWLGMCVR